MVTECCRPVPASPCLSTEETDRPTCALFPRSGHALFYERGANKGAGALPTVSATQAGWRLPYLKPYLMFYITVPADHLLKGAVIPSKDQHVFLKYNTRKQCTCFDMWLTHDTTHG